MTVPLLDKAPTVDGTVADSEWDQATLVTDFFQQMGGAERLVPDRVKLYAGYHGDTVYLAWQIFREKGFEKPAAKYAPGKQEHIWMKDDNIEVVIEPGARDKGINNFYTIVGNSVGAYSETSARLDSSGHGAWEGKWTYRAHITPFGWEGELEVPLTTFFKAEKPGPGVEWRFSFIEQPVTPAKKVFTWEKMWAYGESDYRSNTKGIMRFADQGTIVRLDRMGKLKDDTLGLKFHLLNRGAQPVKVRAEMEAFYSPVKYKEGETMFFDIWDHIREIRRVGKFKAGAGTEKVQTFAGEEEYLKQLNTRFTYYQSKKQDAIIVEPGQSREITLEIPSKNGEFLVGYRLVDEATSQIIAEHALPVGIFPSLTMEFIPYWLKWEVLHVVTDVSLVPGMQAGDTVEWTLKSKNGKAAFGSGREKWNAKTDTVETDLPTKDLKPGEYQVEAKALDATGKVLATNTDFITKPATPAWHNNNIGKTKVVPPPFEPVKANGTKLTFWKRTYDFGSSFLPQSFIARDTEILARPLNLILETSAGKETVEKVTVKTLESSDLAVVYEMQGESASLALSARVTAEYDGLLRFDWTFKPLKGPVTVQKLILEIPLKKEYGLLYAIGATGTVPAQQYLWDRAGFVTNFSRYYPDNQMPFTYGFFLGADDRGIQWCAESDKGWSPQDETKELALRISDKETVLEVRFADKPFELKDALALTWGITVTPIRDASYGQNRVTRTPYSPESMIDIFDKPNTYGNKDYVINAKENGVTHISAYGELQSAETFGAPRAWVPGRVELLKKYCAEMKKLGLQTDYYCGWGINKCLPDCQDFWKAMRGYPLRDIGFNCYSHNPGSPYADYFIYHVKFMVEEVGFAGLHLDSTFSPCLFVNQLDGFGWTRDGVLHGTYPLFAYRDLLRRLYVYFHVEAKLDGKSMLHLHGGTDYTLAPFADLRGVGEPDYNGKSLASTYEPGYYRAYYATYRNGFATDNARPGWMDLNFSQNEFFTAVVLHNTKADAAGVELLYKGEYSYDTTCRPHKRIWKLFRDLPVAKAEFHPYYENHGMTVNEPAHLMTTVYLIPGKHALVAIGNYKPEYVKAKIAFVPEKFGFTGPKVAVKDALLNNYCKPDNDGRYTLEFYPERYRLLWVTPSK